MDPWIAQYQKEAGRFLKQGYVRAIEFSGSTYQVEVYDPKEKESYWPFLQFDEQGALKDAFCSCFSEEERCVHLAAAYLAIHDAQEKPLHVRFSLSFWNQLCQLLGDLIGYDERFLEKQAEGHYLFENEISLEIKTKTPAMRQRLKQWIENRPKENPENSIKFSNVSQEEIARWREGRPGPELRYALSFWSDLAQWMMTHSEEGAVQFHEDDEGYPTYFDITFPTLAIACKIKKKDLPTLIPSLDTVNSSLKVFQAAAEQVQTISFDPQEKAFKIEHASLMPEKESQKTLPLEGWAYLSGVGFYSMDGQSLLGKSRITEEEIPTFIENFSQQIEKFIPIHSEQRTVHYEMHFDPQWNWHFEAYLFKPHDLSENGGVLVDGWVYLPKKGFYPIQEALFPQIQVTLPISEASHFVNHHRIWLNSQEGFQTHLASIESHLSYTVVGDHLRFLTKAQVEGAETMDFGDWIYYGGQGFFSKKHARLGLVIRPGLDVKGAAVGDFIKKNREELENIPRFFAPAQPLATRGLEISVHSSFTLHVNPVFTLLPPWKEAQIQFFGDFIYIPGEGFAEIPLALRLPDEYEKPLVISQNKLQNFLETELPNLRKYLVKSDPALTPPHKVDLTVEYLVRIAGGGLKAQLYYHTDIGKVAVSDLLDAIENKRRFCFTEAGLIDTHSDLFQWMRTFKNPYNLEGKTVELSTLDFIRLDASFGLLGPVTEGATSQITRNLMKELREFTSHESPNLKGLKSELRLYQQTGLHWLWFLYRHGLSGLLCDDMGLGKTHQAMALIAATLNQTSQAKRRYLVVCPTSVIYHWQDKLEMFLPNIKVHTFHGLKRSLSPKTEDGLILTSYGILRMEQKLFESLNFDVAIFDEIQVAKNPSSRVHEVLKKVQAKTRIGLTGTPIENNLRELKALFDIVLPGYMPSEARFRELFIQPIERDADEEKKNLLTRLIRPFVLRRRKSEVLQELPEKSEDKSYCDLSEEQTKLYQETISQNREALIAELRDGTAPVNFVHVFSLLSRMKQICDHPALVHKDPGNYKKHESGKWDLFVELLEEARESNLKVVVFSQYLYMLDIMESFLQERKWGYAQIRGDTVNRREELRRFQEDPECVVFIGSLQAAGLGIDLTAAQVVILYDRWWNAARENQAIDRVHRIGQKWGVQVYKLITKNTLEEKIDKMITRKGRLLEEVVLADDQAVLKKFTRSELIDLFTFYESP